MGNGDSTVDVIIDREQLSALMLATKESKRSYESDISSLIDSLADVKDDAPIVSNFTRNISDLLSDSSYSEAYDKAIKKINDII